LSKVQVKNESELIAFGKKLSAKFKGGEVIELVGDLGVGKTTLTKGIAQGLEVKSTINSPSFTIMKEYSGRKGLILKHYDFYRLDNSGIMKNEILDSLNHDNIITVVEWAKDIAGILPKNRRTIKLSYLADNDGRLVEWN
jgi:tRNA threonylcarbamoyladenosine biosynthesis protein TsaE